MQLIACSSAMMATRHMLQISVSLVYNTIRGTRTHRRCMRNHASSIRGSSSAHIHSCGSWWFVFFVTAFSLYFVHTFCYKYVSDMTLSPSATTVLPGRSDSGSNWEATPSAMLLLTEVDVYAANYLQNVTTRWHKLIPSSYLSLQSMLCLFSCRWDPCYSQKHY